MMSQLLTQNIGNPALGDSLQGQTGVSFVQGLLPALINTGFVIGSVIFLFTLIAGGIKWVSSGGDKGELEQARSHVTQAVVGIFVLFAVYAIMSFVEFFFGVNLTVFDLETLRISGSGAAS